MGGRAKSAPKDLQLIRPIPIRASFYLSDIFFTLILFDESAGNFRRSLEASHDVALT